MNTPSRFAASLFVACSAMLATPAIAETYPEKNVTIVVPYAPGGGADMLSRLLGQKLGDLWGSPVVVENRAGAGGSVGTAYAARTAADGYTFLMASPSHTINGALYKDLPFDAAKDFDAVVMVASGPLALVVPSKGSIQSLDDFLTQAKTPGTINYASAGVGSSPHLAGELLNQLADVQMVHVPYQGTGPALTDLLANRVHAMFAPVPAALPHLKSGALKVLAVTSAEPFSALPGAPALAERLPDYEVLQWWGLVTSAGAPQEIVQKVNADVASVLQSADVQERLNGMGAVAGGQPSATFQKLIVDEIPKWEAVVKAANVKAE